MLFKRKRRRFSFRLDMGNAVKSESLTTREAAAAGSCLRPFAFFHAVILQRHRKRINLTPGNCFIV